MEKLNWKDYWKNYRAGKVECKDDLFFQVGATINKKPISNETHEKIILDIKHNLNLNEDDSLLEMCCGNGLITKPLSFFCKSIYAFDFTEHLINSANEYNVSENIVYKVGNAKEQFLDLFQFENKPNKVLMCFSLGYFTEIDLELIAHYLDQNLESFQFYLTGIPNDDFKFNFYNTPERKEHYYSLVEKGDLSNNGIGKWWKYEEFLKISNKYNLNCQIFEKTQVDNYRMNVLFTK
jgi:Ribosomal RNA adenine dimethylase